ncbi:MAG: STAS domain-containing protein [Nitrospirae bacterium]|nr:STAS domain-containing protein [Nitrospirota bacterium]
MEINTKKTGNILVVSLKGRMDAVSSPGFDGNLLEWTTAGENNFIIDLSALEYISSAGLRSLLSAAKQIKARDGKLMLSGLSGAVQEVFKLSGFYSIFQIFASETEALQSV